MIQRIDIPNFGSFRDFDWNTSVRDGAGNIHTFKKLNILYGRNYSGKTTLSRVLRSLETGKLPANYEAPFFSVCTSTGEVTQQQIPVKDIEIRVYNRDFVDEHLSFLRDSEGNITPFAVIGSENAAIEKEIAEKEGQLGNTEERKGLRYEYASKEAEVRVAKGAKSTAEQALNDKLFSKANQPQGGIKHNPLYRDVNYDIRKIRADIITVRGGPVGVLSGEDREEKESLLKELPLADIENRLDFTPAIVTLHQEARNLLSRRITPSKPIQELLNDAVLQTWVKEGIPYHKGKRKKCAFCGGILPQDLWARLDAHFSKESTDLETALCATITAIETEKKTADEIVTVDRSAFYSVFHTAFDDAKRALVEEIKRYQAYLDSLVTALRSRLANIFTPQTISELPNFTAGIAARVSSFNELIEKSNKKTESLQEDQDAAREDLRLSEVAQFVLDIDLEGEEKKIAQLGENADGLEKDLLQLREKVEAIENRLKELRVQLKDEKRGAEKVNSYLNHYFGHEGLRLEAVEDAQASAYKFHILRGDTPAYNLSEGECSLVSFCYFVAKLDDTESSGKKLTIYIDDPVSSLDSNHIFFVFSLIEGLIAAPEQDAYGEVRKGPDGKPVYRYEQLFVSTHNLEFLKYLKKLSRPKRDSEQFLVVCKNGESGVELMPAYLRNYITEFNHLFGEVYTCVDPANAATHYHCFYNFGNNLRRFLEAYLFFKFPFSDDQKDYNRRIQMFFEGDPGTEALVKSLTNEFSHLGGVFDRSMQPVDHTEISKLAAFVLRKVKERDEEQFQCLLKSIKKPDPWP